MKVETLKSEFSNIAGVEIVEGNAGFPLIKIENNAASAEISVYGGQVLSYKPANQRELLFLSDKAYYEEGKAIKGGIPVCWPAFGDAFLDQGVPFHGFARNTFWGLKSIERHGEALTEVILQLKQDDASLKLFPYEFLLTLKVIVSSRLTIELITENRSNEEFNITQALHTYFSVQDINRTSVCGLDKIQYLDKAKSNTGAGIKYQQGDVQVDSEVDRIYLNVPQSVSIKDRAAQREIQIQSEGNQALVVWNPWKELCEQSSDLANEDYQRFICVETANAADNIITVKPGKSSIIAASYSVKKSDL